MLHTFLHLYFYINIIRYNRPIVKYPLRITGRKIPEIRPHGLLQCGRICVKITFKYLILNAPEVFGMFQIMSARQAVDLIKDGDCVCVNSFLALSNAEEIHRELYTKYLEMGSPRGITFVSSAGFGMWDEERNAEPFISSGAVKRLILGHYGSMPRTARLAMENKIEAYNLPLGAISQAIRAQAGGLPGCVSKVGLGIFVDPRVDGSGINELSRDNGLVKLVELDGEEYLYYKLPKLNAAIIKGTTADPNGNITFEKECVTVDALSTAQAVKANGGVVIVQVDRVNHEFMRPREVIVPGVFVDAVVVVEREAPESMAAVTGDAHIPTSQLLYWNERPPGGAVKKRAGGGASADIIGKRAAAELKAGDIVNIGIGIPESVGKYAAKSGILRDITLTVESGGMGGMPASGASFGAVIGPDMICDMSLQFDFYNGGGLDICFMGALEVDGHGNVNAHRGSGAFSGIGGFANITCATKTVVFCLTFTAKGIDAQEKDGKVEILREGSIAKFKKEIDGISFSAEQALKRGQRVLYVTERCVFELTRRGLRLAEVYPGIDAEKDIIDKLDFDVEY